MARKKSIWAKVVYLQKFKEISKAVQLVAIAKLRKLRNVLDAREHSLSMAVEMFDSTYKEDSIYTNHCIVVVTSERSCCGKLNSEVLTAAKEAIDSLVVDSKVVRIVSIGWKGKDSLSVKHSTVFSHSLSYVNKSCFSLAYVVLLSVLDTEYDRCAIYFSKYYKIFEQVAAVYEFRSYTLFLDTIYRYRKDNMLFEVLISNSDVNLRQLYYYNACLVLLDAFEETKYSELGCRAFAMEMAHRNAVDLITVQMLLFNKARQSAITTELLEVVGGATYTA